MKWQILFWFYCLVAVSISAQNKKPISHEDMWMMKRVGAPAISPDSKWVIFSVLDPAYDAKDQIEDIYIVPSDGSLAPRKITAGKAGESNYTWSHDGKHIAFVAKREQDEQAQVYLLNIKEGGEAQRFSNITTGASNPKWSPDGKYILFSSEVYPSCYVDSCNKKKMEEEKALKYKARVYTQFPIRNWDKWKDVKQTHFFVQSIHPDSVAEDIFKEVSIANNLGFGAGQAIWSADSKSILFIATTEANKAAFQDVSSHIYRVSIYGGEPIQLTSGFFGFNTLQISEDGKYLYTLRTTINTHKIYHDAKLWQYDYPTMKNEKQLVKNLDRPINKYFITNNINYISAQHHGRELIYTIDQQTGNANVLTSTTYGCYTNLSTSINSSSLLVANYSSAYSPSEIVRIQADGKHANLSNFNIETLKQLDLQETITFWHTNSQQQKIRSLLIKPAGFDPTKKYPLFIFIHGGPASAFLEDWSYRWNYHLLAQPGYIILCTDYTGSTGYGEQFGQAIQFDPFRGAAQEIQDAAAEAIKQFPFIDASRQAAGGASYGGHLTNWLQGTTSHYKCLISHAGLVNSVSQWGTSDVIYGRELMNGGVPWGTSKIWQDQNPFRFADKFKTPMLITIGELDFRVPLNNSIENYYLHQRQQVPSKLIVFPEENHWILKAENSKFFYQEVHAWLEKYLK